MKKQLATLAVVTPLLFGGAAFATQNHNEHESHRVTICHHTESEQNPTVTIEVDKHAVKAHLKHGDTLGECPPKEQPPTPPVTETPKTETPAPVAPTEQAPAVTVSSGEVFTGK